MCPSGRSRPAKHADEHLRPAFNVLDADRDGKISPDDLRTFYAGIPGAAPGEEDLIGTMIYFADANNDGYVEYEDLERVIDGFGEGGNGSVMRGAFRVMDRDGDGWLSREDLKSFLELAGLGARDEDVAEMMRLGGDEAGDRLSYEALLKILAVDDVF